MCPRVHCRELTFKQLVDRELQGIRILEAKRMTIVPCCFTFFLKGFDACSTTGTALYEERPPGMVCSHSFSRSMNDLTVNFLPVGAACSNTLCFSICKLIGFCVDPLPFSSCWPDDVNVMAHHVILDYCSPVPVWVECLQCCSKSLCIVDLNLCSGC